MKKLFVLFVAAMAVNFCVAQKTETRTIGDINKLVVGGKTFVLEVIPSTENKLELTSTDIGFDKILTTESNGELKVTVKGVFNTGNVVIKMYCKTIPVSMESNNGAIIKSTEKLVVGQIALTTNSDGYIHLILESQNVTATCNSGGDMTLEGTTGTFTSNANMNASLRAEGLNADNGTVKATSGAEVFVSVKNNLASTTVMNGKVHIYKPYPVNITETNESGGTLIKE